MKLKADPSTKFKSENVNYMITFDHDQVNDAIQLWIHHSIIERFEFIWVKFEGDNLFEGPSY